MDYLDELNVLSWLEILNPTTLTDEYISIYFTVDRYLYKTRRW